MTEFDDLVRRVQELEVENGRLRADYDHTLHPLASALDLKMGFRGHSKRVNAFSLAIAHAMGLPFDQIVIIARGSLLHDIGKTGIPDEILRKPEKLDEEETAIMRKHCCLGYKMLGKIPVLEPVRAIIHSHHEHYDGAGYPQGLSGQQIPLGARIVAIANTLDSINSDLPYRRSRPFTAARNEIAEWSGRQFDPEVVKVFQEIPEKRFEDLKRNANSHSLFRP
jgi:putative nucleotidyltransferase with HDIG domain